jgi:hypothetical protein
VCACGYHESFANDPTNHFTFDVRVCPVCKGSAQFGRMVKHADDKRQQARERRRGDDGSAPIEDPADGRKIITRLMNPLEVQQGQAVSA